ncbi:hypothetical protein ACJRO7_017136 [Eucalyptus globulus]|uniref:TPR1-like CTLH-containing domain-containing protein n=1 Tax=Eucalyptus globulus TaxID=34317 RepID=A0ABD3KPE5_EUCGL
MGAFSDKKNSDPNTPVRIANFASTTIEMALPDIPEMPLLDAHLILIILYILKEEGPQRKLHKRESGVHFDWSYFEELVRDGLWDEVEKYLLDFTRLDDN